MADRLWQHLLTRPNATPGWELFHENSKITRYSDFLPEEEIRRHMAGLWQSLPMAHAPAIALPGPGEMAEPEVAITAAIRARRTPDDMSAAPMPLTVLASLLYHMAGLSPGRGQEDRPFRMVPSGGALYPIEIFLHLRTVEDLAAGFYYYDPRTHALHALPGGDRSEEIAACLVQPGMVADSAVQVFQTAMFARSTFKYGDRGYRFTLFEAGHQAQNLSLMATALGLGCIHAGGFRDHAIDSLLGLDGLNHSILYLAFLGKPDDAGDA